MNSDQVNAIVVLMQNFSVQELGDILAAASILASRTSITGTRELAQYLSDKYQLRIDGIAQITGDDRMYQVQVRSYDASRKIHFIKVIREITLCGLKEAKDKSEEPLPIRIGTLLSDIESRELMNKLNIPGVLVERVPVN
jgi:ribosomal protein L7/L12